MAEDDFFRSFLDNLTYGVWTYVSFAQALVNRVLI